jgi:hypothetical protein
VIYLFYTTNRPKTAVILSARYQWGAQGWQQNSKDFVIITTLLSSALLFLFFFEKKNVYEVGM